MASSSPLFDPSLVRNLCIVAHVDHGKTTLADSLVASNGIISRRMAGKLRYMDSRPDEQERGITMKSSAVSLAFDGGHTINLIDSPGHVDFSSEVSTAVRLCDGAIVVVDVVEGVQPQTKVVLQQTWQEGIKPVLVLNKMDRLVTEMKLAPLDAYVHLSQVLEQVNAVIGELFASQVMIDKGEKCRDKTETVDGGDIVFDDWSTGLEDADDSDIYFSPERGNVVFASAYDGWGFDLSTFAKIYSERLGFSESVLTRTLWGDFYVNAKAKRIAPGAQAKAKKPLFVQLILDNIWSIYEASAVERNDREKLQSIAESLGLKLAARDLRSSDPRLLLNALFSQWLPLAPCLLRMVCQKLPPPNQLSAERAEKLMCSRTKRFDVLPAETRKLKEAFVQCSGKADAPVIVFVSKMFPVQKSQLPENRPKPLSAEEMASRRELAKQRHTEKTANDSAVMLTEDNLKELKLDDGRNDMAFVAFARVFSGTLRPGQQVYVLGPKFDPAEALAKIESGKEVCDESATVHTVAKGHIMRATVKSIYLLLGRELEELAAAPAGSVVGIGGLEDYILKSATLSSVAACPAFVEVTQSAVPILRVAVEPTRSSDMARLMRGLHLLNQADINVQVLLTDKGEHILVTAGEVHLERCLRDLNDYTGVEVNASAPIVPFRETIVRPPKTDMRNEQFGDDNRIFVGDTTEAAAVAAVIKTNDKRCTIRIRAVPLEREATDLLEKSTELFKALDRESSQSLAEHTLEAKEKLRRELIAVFSDDDDLRDCADKIWSIGPRKCGPNLLINNIPGYDRPSFWCSSSSPNQKLLDYDSSVINGFQLSTMAGPLCEEPMMGVAFFVDECSVCADKTDDVFGPLSGQIVSAVKEGCRKAFQARPQRLMAAMYSCDIQVKAEALGKLFASLGKRHGKNVREEMVEGSSTFSVTAHLPVIESFQFAQEIRRQTSGLAMPQLVFSHWEVIDVDPFWVPQSEEEILHYGDKADSENQARRYVNDVRKKKGLAIDEKIVEFAEKQRTLTKMK